MNKPSKLEFFDLVLRGVAALFGGFVLLNLAISAMDGGVDSNLWWIDLRWAPAWLALLILLVAGTALLLAGLLPRKVSRWFTRPVFGLLFVLSFVNGMTVLAVFFDGRAHGGGVPLSFGFALFFLILCESVSRIGRSTRRSGLPGWCALGAGAALFGLLLPLALVWTFGNTIYVGDHGQASRNRATAVIFGAGVRPDGTPSLALEDRTQTAIGLYKDGVVDQLYLSGGPGPNGQHEVEAMRRLALSEGVPEAALQLDREGLSTGATARHAAHDVQAGPVYAVSHAYHLPRVEMAFWEQGLDVRTVPANETRPLARRHLYLAREVPGFWFYWARRGLAALGFA